MANVPWIRLWGRDCIDDPTCRTAQLSNAHFGMWVKTIWRLARCPDTGKGYLADGSVITDARWASLLGVKASVLRPYLAVVMDTLGLLYRDERGAICAENIEKSVPSEDTTNSGRQRRYRERHATDAAESNGVTEALRNGGVTAPRARGPEPEPEPEPETENPPTPQSKSPKPARKGDLCPDLEWPATVDTPRLRELFAEWVANRQDMGKPCTERSQRMALKKLGDYPSARHAAAALEDTIARGWTGILLTDDRKAELDAPDPALAGLPAPVDSHSDEDIARWEAREEHIASERGATDGKF